MSLSFIIDTSGGDDNPTRVAPTSPMPSPSMPMATTWSLRTSIDNLDRVYFRLFNADGTPKVKVKTPITPEPEFDGHVRCYAQVAADKDGDFIVTWTITQGGDADIYARRFAANGDPLGGVPRQYPWRGEFRTADDLQAGRTWPWTSTATSSSSGRTKTQPVRRRNQLRRLRSQLLLQCRRCPARQAIRRYRAGIPRRLPLSPAIRSSAASPWITCTTSSPGPATPPATATFWPASSITMCR